jgi:hypothetical protein
VYALHIEDDFTIQGLIASRVEKKNRAVHIDIVEAAPHNYGSTGKYDGIGINLFAFACKQAEDNDCDAVYFKAKTNLIDYYHEKLGAEIVTGQTMIIEGKAFNALIRKFYR